MHKRFAMMAVAWAICVFAARAEEQVWDDACGENVWSTSVTNWTGGAVWTNGNSAVFSGAGGTQAGESVDVSGSVLVADMTFQTNGYVIADADADGALAFAGGGEVRVVNTGDLAVVSEVIGGAGFTKTGPGVLQLAGANTFTGLVRVAAGTLRLSKWNLGCLGATGTVHGTIVESGATLDIYGAISNTLKRTEYLELAGSGVNGTGALINTGSPCMNSGFNGTTTLRDDTTVGCYSRIDFCNNVVGNNYTLTKIGSQELAVGVEVNNCRIVINNGYYTYMNAKALGTNDFDTTMNGGALRSYGNQTVTEYLICNGGSFIAAGYKTNTFNIVGRVTLNSNVIVTASDDGGGTGTLNLSGLLEGTGGIRRQGAGHYVFVTGDTNTYSGPTIVDSGCSLWVGKTNLYSGVLGVGTVTNYGTLNGCSRRISDGRIMNMGGASLNVYTGSLGAASTVNSGTLYLRGGELGTGTVVNSGNIVCFSPVMGGGVITNNGGIYFDRVGTAVCTNQIFGGGGLYVRYGCDAVLSSACVTNYALRVANGSMTLTNGSSLIGLTSVYVADRGVSYAYTLTNANAWINLYDGASLETKSIVMGDGGDVSTGRLAGAICQYGGDVRTSSCTAESNGVRLAHWPQADCTYNMMGGTLTVDNGWDLCIATDGTGWVHQTGGEIYTSRVKVHERVNNTRGRGRLTVEGGVLNIGLTNGIPNVDQNDISVDGTATYLVEYGGMGGVVRAITNFVSSLNATLYGTGTNAVTFDTKEWGISLSGKLSGAGGLNKAGTGTLTLSGNNTYSGATRIQKGRLVPASASALPAGGQVLFDVADDDSGGVLHATGDFSVSALNVGVANPEILDKAKHYTIITCEGELSGTVANKTLPDPWYLYYDRTSGAGRVELRAAVGTVILMR